MIPWSPTASSPSSRASSRSPEVEDRSAGAPAGSPAPRGKRDGLLQRREGGGQEDLVLLRQQPVRSSWWGPDAILPCLVPHPRALVEARVSPDVDEAVSLAELDATGEHDGRELHALGKLRLPALRHVGQRAGLERVVAQLEDRPDLPGTNLGHE